MPYHRERLKSLIQRRALIDEAHPSWPRLQELSPGAPWLFDFKPLLGTVDFLSEIAEAFWQTCRDWYPFQLAGLETAAYPMMTAIQMAGKAKGCDVSAVMIRKSRKKYGLFQDYDGAVADLPIVMIDDLINRGRTLAMCQAKLGEHADKIEYGFSLLDMENQGTRHMLREQNIEWRSLYRLSEFGKKRHARKNVAQERVRRLRPRLAWKWSDKNPIYKFPMPKSEVVLNGRYAYAGTNAGSLHAWDADTGKRIWSLDTHNATRKGSASSPLVVGDQLIWAAYDGNVYCVDAETGDVAWVNCMADHIGSSPVWDRDNSQVVVAVEFELPKQKGGVLALDPATGDGRWQHAFAGYAHCTPAVAAGAVFAADNSGDLVCLGTTDGELRWRKRFANAIRAPITYDRDTESVLVPCFDHRVYRVAAKDGAEILSYHSHGPVLTQPAVHDGLVVFGSTDKFLYIYDLNNGELRTTIKTWGRVFSAPRVWQNAVIFGSNDGMIRLVDLDSMTQAFAFRIRERVLSPVTIGENKMYINTGNEVFAIRFD